MATRGPLRSHMSEHGQDGAVHRSLDGTLNGAAQLHREKCGGGEPMERESSPIVLVLVWGAWFGAVPVAAQTWMAQTMPQTVEGGLALFVSALRGSLAAGSAIGGLLYNTYGTVGLLLTAAIAGGLGSAAVSGRTAAVDTKP
jgi:hypothetical protein